ncbi:Biopolymer transport protein ExbB [Pirellulimonas nuda]|uniref:Biopolymer transport protein ExbB n=1 Tax=Pirellulimonas nuda TaxID=2528009 RepID=A0A518DAG5_9BACT|nr:MotA/TolQ/ExbB proton channel family protein [Pirellulimonas nuda]QDU88474.1 Biopolymer transport protein ExbB [Pirellulimonas nuda]
MNRIAILLVCLAGALVAPAQAQPPDPSRLAEQALAPPAAEAAEAEPGDAASLNYLELLLSGGPLMIPIGLLSLLVLAIGLERWIGLRRRAVAPRGLFAGLRRLADDGAIDPRLAYALCQRYPSSAARVTQAMLLKTGRPQSEVEHAVSEASQREADRLYSNVRTLNMAAAVAPLLGLLGTVWGMIQSFFATANLPIGSNKGQALAEGIYVALVTTLAGLAVAIPAAVLAHMFEGRILRMLRDTQDFLAEIIPQLDRYEGKLRLDPRDLASGGPRRQPTDLPHPVPAPHADVRSAT